MKRISFLLLAAFFISLHLQSQTLYQPRNVKTAFENGTRTMNGKPGPHYWQNRSNYDIDLTLSPPNTTIKGYEEITYFNDSPDTLKTVIFRLTMNYHKPEAGRAAGLLFNLDPLQLNSGIYIDHLKMNGEEMNWPEATDDYTWQNIPLKEPLLPGDSVHFSVEWHYDIAPALGASQRANREGMIDPTTWCVAYFYPRVAVYDDYNGWDRLPFTGAQEFYNDFSNYTLKVHVPKNFIVWATGTLQNPDEVLQPHYAQLLKKSMTSDVVIHIATPVDLEQKNITRQNACNTWIWKAGNVTEVALFISNHDNWDAASVVVDSATGRRASVQSAYDKASGGFHQAAAIGQKTIGWYSRNFPGVPYPYPKMTVVEGFAGMEYPMMVNDGATATSASDSDNVKGEEHHEIAHTYFPFYTGINESRYAFMDEGWANVFGYLVDLTEANPTVRKGGWTYSHLAAVTRDSEQEMQVPMIEVNLQTSLAYAGNAYAKPMWAYLALKDLLGDQLFRKCLQGYIARWHGKHPIPWDFFNSFNDISGKNLNWFWNSWFFSHGYDDLGVGNVEKTNTGYAVTIKNVGGFAIPFNVKIKYGDGSTNSIHQTPIVWKEHPGETTIHIQTKKIIRSLIIDNGIWMDANEKDNGWSGKNETMKN